MKTSISCEVCICKQHGSEILLARLNEIWFMGRQSRTRCLLSRTRCLLSIYTSCESDEIHLSSLLSPFLLCASINPSIHPGFQVYGDRWLMISLLFMQHRHPREIKLRWGSLVKEWNKSDVIQEYWQKSNQEPYITPPMRDFLVWLAGGGLKKKAEQQLNTRSSSGTSTSLSHGSCGLNDSLVSIPENGVLQHLRRVNGSGSHRPLPSADHDPGFIEEDELMSSSDEDPVQDEDDSVLLNHPAFGHPAFGQSVPSPTVVQEGFNTSVQAEKAVVAPAAVKPLSPLKATVYSRSPHGSTNSSSCGSGSAKRKRRPSISSRISSPVPAADATAEHDGDCETYKDYKDCSLSFLHTMGDDFTNWNRS